MGCRRKRESSFMSLVSILLGAVISHCLLIPALCQAEAEFEGFYDSKNYYTSSPHGSHHRGGRSTPDCDTPPSGSYGTPHHGGGGTPDHGGGGYYHSPPTGSGSVTPPSHAGGYSNPPPTGGEPGGGMPMTPPSTDGYSYTPPSGGEPGGPLPLTPPSDGGYYNSPPTSSGPGFTPPSGSGYLPPITGGGGSPFFPTPTTPIFPIDPNIASPFGTCTWWITHPSAIFGLFGYVGTVGGLFGTLCTQVFGHDMSLMQALTNRRTDGYGNLFREGTASFLNSMAHQRFPFTVNEVRNHFTTSLISNDAAAAQAKIFRQANEGRLGFRQ